MNTIRRDELPGPAHWSKGPNFVREVHDDRFPGRWHLTGTLAGGWRNLGVVERLPIDRSPMLYPDWSSKPEAGVDFYEVTHVDMISICEDVFMPTNITPERTVLAATHGSQRTNIDDALEIVTEIDQVRAVIRELKAAFGRSELDGGAKAAPQHPLYVQCQERLAELHDRLLMVL